MVLTRLWWKSDACCFPSIALMTVWGKLQTASVLQCFLAASFTHVAEADFSSSFLWHINAVPKFKSWFFTRNYIPWAQHHWDPTCLLHISCLTVTPTITALLFEAEASCFMRRNLTELTLNLLPSSGHTVMAASTFQQASIPRWTGISDETRNWCGSAGCFG